MTQRPAQPKGHGQFPFNFLYHLLHGTYWLIVVVVFITLSYGMGVAGFFGALIFSIWLGGAIDDLNHMRKGWDHIPDHSVGNAIDYTMRQAQPPAPPWNGTDVAPIPYPWPTQDGWVVWEKQGHYYWANGRPTDRGTTRIWNKREITKEDYGRWMQLADSVASPWTAQSLTKDHPVVHRFVTRCPTCNAGYKQGAVPDQCFFCHNPIQVLPSHNPPPPF